MALTVFTVTSPSPLPFSLRHRRSSPYSPMTSLRRTSSPILRHQFPCSFPSRSRRPRRRILTVNSQLVNGFSILDTPEKQGFVDEVELGEKMRRTFEKLRSVLPGGRWWNLSDENVDVTLVAKPVTVWNALYRMWQLVSNDRWVIFAAFSALIFTALSEISIPHFLTASIFSAQSGKVTVFRQNVLLLVIFCITSGICRSKSCMVKRMRETLYSSLLLQDISFFDSSTVGELTSRLGADCQQVSRVIGNDLNLISRNILQGTGALIYLLILSWPLGLCTLAICIILLSIMTLYGQLNAFFFMIHDCILLNVLCVAHVCVRLVGTVLSCFRICWLKQSGILLLKNRVETARIYDTVFEPSRAEPRPSSVFEMAQPDTFTSGKATDMVYQKKAAKLTQEFAASANEVAQETLSLMRTVRVYGTEEREFQRYELWLEKLAGISLRQSAAYGLWTFSFNTLYHSTQVIAALIGGMSILAGHLSAEQLTKFLLYSEWLIYSTWWIGDNVSSLMQSVGASEQVFRLMDLVPSEQFTSGGLKLQQLTGNIDFVNVSFHYPTRPEVPVLQGLNISMRPNEVTAIVGLSGSGKSTIVNLLLRLYEPTSGEILIDGVSLRELDAKWLREKIGYVGQEPRLFRMDISSNIRYGCPRDVTQEDIEWAAKQAFAHDFISALPNGYNTIVDDDLLSGGQKQRIAIARAVLRDPTILILDEATSALDAESEHNIKGVLRAVRNDSRSRRTVMVIAHRLSTIQAADRIVVMNSGQIVEMGSHKELLLKDGLYARLTRRQADAVA
ncbi:hypothetical protein Cgig2_024626 [Carnegiea gigantea]|uniref:ABC transporter B family member 26, chloroplastic n=1 Tax=Carnegiea gigantea TaxID=171969 RepID=A0A9Q1QDV3_9CARY|nr:hypothetical protein Cgig2_024626 [Carnegiea gigantea]